MKSRPSQMPHPVGYPDNYSRYGNRYGGPMRYGPVERGYDRGYRPYPEIYGDRRPLPPPRDPRDDFYYSRRVYEEPQYYRSRSPPRADRYGEQRYYEERPNYSG